MVDNQENILVEFDYDNIIVVDPNKVINDEGKAQERLVKHENLVMYANLECDVVPRTKLATGVGINDTIQTISVAKINFLNPGGKTFLDNSYTDEITGKNTINGEGVNQPTKNEIKTPNRSEESYIRQTVSSNGKQGSTVDNGLLGIVSISIRQNTSFMPVITVQLEDVKGRALFEGGDNSPYAAFFNLPYPLFYLTIKGFYGKALRLPLMLQNFTSRYDVYSGNFSVTLTFYSYKYTILSEISMGALFATPHMYKSRLNVQTVSGNDSKFSPVEDKIYERGYEKIKELYGEYKSKGLIPNDFPEITLIQMANRLENFVKNIMDSFTKENMDPLTNLETYESQLINYRKKVYFGAGSSWFDKYMDTKNFFILNNEYGTKVYTFKAEFKEIKKSEAAISELKSILTEYNGLLNDNETVGLNGSYTVDGDVKKISIPNNIKYDIFPISINEGDVNVTETYRRRKGLNQQTINADTKFQAELNKELNSTAVELKDGDIKQINYYFKFEGVNNFVDLTDKMLKDLKTKREQIQDDLTKSLSKLLQSKENGIGFVPTIRNVLAVIFANGEAFLRLMDEVHRKAWDVRENKDRKNAVLNAQVASITPENPKSENIEKTPIYPWPQYIVETSGENGQEKYEVAYPGDSQYLSQTKGNLFDVWPEIEFVEEFIKGYSERTSPPADPTENSNLLTEPSRSSVNTIEFPITNEVYENKEEVKFFYEIFERLFLSSNYTGLNRVVDNATVNDAICNVISNTETENIVKSLSNDNPFIIKKLKEYALNSSNFELVLRHFSNDGVGQSWQNFIRGIFNTAYIKNVVDNDSFKVLNSNILNNEISQPLVSVEGEDSLVELISNSTVTDDYKLIDVYPFTDITWDTTFLANGKTTVGSLNNSFTTKRILTFNKDKKVISNFLGTDLQNEKRPITNFIFENVQVPSSYEQNLKNFFETREIKNQLVTEGNVFYNNYNGLVTANQTTSIFNTPYFINSIQEGVTNFRNSVQYPYVSSAYLFINSLPLNTLKEKYKTYSNGTEIPLDYMFATFIKFGAIHKVPYAWILKMGSVWHRYKTFIDTNTDILTNCWNDFNYANNFDPVNGNLTTNYTLIINGGAYDIVLQKDTINGPDTSTVINTGFYPKVINDFNVFYQGLQVFAGYTNADLQNGLGLGVNLNYIPNSFINYPKGFDPNNANRDLKIIPWSVYVDTPDGVYSYVMPSQGALINQTKNECFKDDKLKIEVNNNTSMYNGSARLFWASPNFGYFDNTKVSIPSPSEYLKKIINDKETQENFSINGSTKGYSNIEEIFSVFDKEVLDYFETEFLNFSKSIYDYDANGLPNGITESQKSFRNFQMLMRNMMKLPKADITGNTTSDFINKTQNTQVVNINNYIKDFLNYDIVFKYGNPLNFDKRLFYTFSNHVIADPFTWRSYNAFTPNGLPSSAGATTVAQSKTTYPNEWKTLETYIGFSTVNGLTYSNNGSYITDFFIDMDIEFSVRNIIDFAPIIKIYATQKLKNNSLNKFSFIQLVENYLLSCDKFRNEIIDNLMIKLQKLLPNVDSTTLNPQQFSEFEGSQTKVELWESFKATNDKWIAGADLNTKTLFEDVLLLDRASRDIGNVVIVDIFKLKQAVKLDNPQVSMLTFVQGILVENNFVVMNIPSYINFYNVQEVSKNPTPKIESSAEFANNLFGTFLSLDYRNSSTKMVCFYANMASEHLANQDNVDNKFGNDAFDFSRAVPMLENQTNKVDWDKSNRVVGFNVDIGPQNQSVFYGFQVGQHQGQTTIESIKILDEMIKQGGNRAVSTQNASLYSVYKVRNYTCTVSAMGNAMIQPTMYFNLRHVPMFSGPYMILSVNHNISPGKFETIFEGIRQSSFTLPKVNNYIQSLKTNLLQNIIQKNKQEKVKQTKDAKGNVISEKAAVAANVNGGKTVDTTPTCTPNQKYEKYTAATTPSIKNSSFINIKNSIIQTLSILNIPDDGKLKYLVFSAFYIESGNSSGFEAYDYNYAGVDLNQYWGAQSENFNKQYFCLSNSVTTLPYAVFDSEINMITFLLKKWEQRTGLVESITKENIAKFWILNFAANQRPENVYTTYDPTDLINLETKVQTAIDLFNSI